MLVDINTPADELLGIDSIFSYRTGVDVTITRVGTNEKYASNWDVVFGGKKKAAAAKSSTPAKATPVKKSAKKTAKAAKKAAPVKQAKKATKAKKK